MISRFWIWLLSLLILFFVYTSTDQIYSSSFEQEKWIYTNIENHKNYIQNLWVLDTTLKTDFSITSECLNCIDNIIANIDWYSYSNKSTNQSYAKYLFDFPQNNTPIFWSISWAIERISSDDWVFININDVKTLDLSQKEIHDKLIGQIVKKRLKLDNGQNYFFMEKAFNWLWIIDNINDLLSWVSMPNMTVSWQAIFLSREQKEFIANALSSFSQDSRLNNFSKLNSQQLKDISYNATISSIEANTLSITWFTHPNWRWLLSLQIDKSNLLLKITSKLDNTELILNWKNSIKEIDIKYIDSKNKESIEFNWNIKRQLQTKKILFKVDWTLLIVLNWIQQINKTPSLEFSLKSEFWITNNNVNIPIIDYYTTVSDLLQSIKL